MTGMGNDAEEVSGGNGDQVDAQPEDVVEAAVIGSWKQHEWLLNYLDMPFEGMAAEGVTYGIRLLIGGAGHISFAFDCDEGCQVTVADAIRDLTWMVEQLGVGKVSEASEANKRGSGQASE